MGLGGRITDWCILHAFSKDISFVLQLAVNATQWIAPQTAEALDTKPKRECVMKWHFSSSSPRHTGVHDSRSADELSSLRRNQTQSLAAASVSDILWSVRLRCDHFFCLVKVTLGHRKKKKGKKSTLTLHLCPCCSMLFGLTCHCVSDPAPRWRLWCIAETL